MSNNFFQMVNIMVDLDDLYRWFDENRASIIADHPNECVLLKDNSVIGYYYDTETALNAAEDKGYILGEFLIQHCVTEEEEMMHFLNYNQAVSFAN